jgi:hypothetical protein
MSSYDRPERPPLLQYAINIQMKPRNHDTIVTMTDPDVLGQRYLQFRGERGEILNELNQLKNRVREAIHTMENTK